MNPSNNNSVGNRKQKDSFISTANVDVLFNKKCTVPFLCHSGNRKGINDGGQISGPGIKDVERA